MYCAPDYTIALSCILIDLCKIYIVDIVDMTSVALFTPCILLLINRDVFWMIIFVNFPQKVPKQVQGLN